MDALFEQLQPALGGHFKLPLTRHEPPQFLLYRAGDFFVAHRDRPRSAETDISSRRVSCVLFLNDDFTGGELNLFGVLEGKAWETAGFPCPAAPGVVAAFPSDMLHEVRPVTSGVRATVVTWFR
jgi:predicted 2-oxoglutarate/Fe(II)-dependent dioxygenase YbiX